MMRSSSRSLLLMGLLLPAMLLAALWLGVYWRLALVVGALLSGLLCVCGLYTCHVPRGKAKLYSKGHGVGLSFGFFSDGACLCGG